MEERSALLPADEATESESTESESTDEKEEATTTTMSQNNIPHPGPFSITSDPNTVAERWKTWIGRLEFYLAATEVTDQKLKVNILVAVAGEEVYDIITNLPEDVKKDSYNEAKAALNDYFAPKANVTYARYLFVSSKYEEGESPDAFVTKLRKAAKACDFNTRCSTEDRITDQLVLRIPNQEIRRKLLQQKDLKLDKALEIIKSMLAVDSQAQDIGKSLGGAGINFVSEGKNKWGKRRTEEQNKWSRERPQVNRNWSGPQMQGKCNKCGFERHSPDKCPARDKTCNYCHKIGHFMNVCMNRKKQGKAVGYVEGPVHQDGDSADEAGSLLSINHVDYENRRIYINVKVNGKPLVMQFDTGSDISTMSEEVARSIPGIVIERCEERVRLGDDSTVTVAGFARVGVTYKGQQRDGMKVTVLKSGRELFGLDWAHSFRMDCQRVLEVGNVGQQATESMTDVMTEFAEVFAEGNGTVKDSVASLVLKSGSHPKFMAPRQIPYALRPAVEREILKWEAEGNWERVTYSEWGTPLVPVAKPDGGVRICGDYKVTVNPQLHVAHHPMPNIHDMQAVLGGCRIFSKVDLKAAFQQLLMDEKSQEMCTVNTHLGLFRPKRLPFGIASSPALWQQTMDRIFNGLPGVFCFIDDILVAGRDEKEHRDRLVAVLSRLRDKGIRIKKEKCQFHVGSVEYLGFRVDGEGVHKTQEKISAITNGKGPGKCQGVAVVPGVSNILW